jgi:hypothetical protein
LRRLVLPMEIGRSVSCEPAEVQGLSRSRPCGGWFSTNMGRVKIAGAGPSGYLAFRAERAVAWPWSEGPTSFAGRKRKGKLQRRSVPFGSAPS